MKIKALNIAFRSICCKCTQNVVNIAWALGSKVLPYSNSSRSMALDNLLLPNPLCTARKKRNGKLLQNDDKSMIKHF